MIIEIIVSKRINAVKHYLTPAGKWIKSKRGAAVFSRDEAEALAKQHGGVVDLLRIRSYYWRRKA